MVPPVEADAPQGAVVLAGAGRSPGPVVGDVDLVHAVELARGVLGQDARQPGAEPGAHGHDDVALAGLGVQVEQALDGTDAVGHRHDVAAGGHGPLGHGQVAGRRRGEHDDVGGRGVGVVDGLGPVAERRHDRGPAPPVGVVDEDRLRGGVGHQVAGRPGADGARTAYEDPHAGYRRPGPLSSRHPPDWGGVPPDPRNRRTAAMTPAMPTAASARRRNAMAAP